MLSKFPGKSAGAGLLLLRLSVACSLVATHLSSADLPSWKLLLAILVAIGLSAGLRTRLLCCLSILGVTSHLAMDSAALALALFNLADTIALALLGPGALSVDARLFGRRTVILPRSRDTIV